METTAEDLVRDLSATIDGLVLKWTFDSLVEDKELDRLFKCTVYLASYSPTRMLVKGSGRSRERLRSPKVSRAMEAFLDRTRSSDSVSASDKVRQFIFYSKITSPQQIFFTIFNSNWQFILRSVEVGHVVRTWVGDKELGLYAQIIVANVIAQVQERGDRWIALAADQ
jgi:hypothetical protein